MLYIDLDGVMADFNKAVLQHTGSEYSGKDTWEILENIPNLFYNLEVLPDAYYALNFIERNFIPYEFLTALPLPTKELYSAHIDKVRWVQRKLHSDAQVNCVSHRSQKKYFVQNGKQDILVDDMLDNCLEWQEAGGIAIYHRNWRASIEELQKYL